MGDVYGGLDVTFQHSVDQNKSWHLGTSPYDYFSVSTEAGIWKNQTIPAGTTYSIVVVTGEALLESQQAKKIEAAQICSGSVDRSVNVRCTGQVLIAYQREILSTPRVVTVTPLAKAKFVEKPWGYERWLVPEGEAFPFMLKEIAINKGFRTSLQYHRQKRESNLVFRGKVELTYSEIKMPNEPPSQVDTSATQLEGPVVVDVFPLHLHRLTALSDVLLYEVSTPEVDDVVRISDDSGRTHGRIESEHARK